MESPLSPERRRHTGFLTAGAVVAMILAGLGIAGAQTSDTTTSTQAPAAVEGERRGPGPAKVNLAVAAGAIGISVDELRSALQSGQSIAQVAQAKNVDPQKVIDALVTNVTADLPERITAAVNQPGGPGGGTGAPGHGKRGGHRGPKPNLGVAATALGMSEADLRMALRSGQSLAQVAQSKNVDVQKVIDALVADAKAKLAAKVQAGEITQAQADERSANLTQRITDMVNRTGGGPRHKDGPPPADAPAGATPASAVA